jgi:hypothetical protein
MRIYLIFLVNLLFSTFLSAQVELEANVLDYIGTPKTSTDRTGLVFSDKGAWFCENYQPLTGAGLEAENFSWSAAHYLLLILEK